MFVFLSRVIVDNVLIKGGRWQRLARCVRQRCRNGLVGHSLVNLCHVTWHIGAFDEVEGRMLRHQYGPSERNLTKNISTRPLPRGRLVATAAAGGRQLESRPGEGPPALFQGRMSGYTMGSLGLGLQLGCGTLRKSVSWRTATSAANQSAGSGRTVGFVGRFQNRRRRGVEGKDVRGPAARRLSGHNRGVCSWRTARSQAEFARFVSRDFPFPRTGREG